MLMNMNSTIIDEAAPVAISIWDELNVQFPKKPSNLQLRSFNRDLANFKTKVEETIDKQQQSSVKLTLFNGASVVRPVN